MFSFIIHLILKTIPKILSSHFTGRKLKSWNVKQYTPARTSTLPQVQLQVNLWPYITASTAIVCTALFPYVSWSRNSREFSHSKIVNLCLSLFIFSVLNLVLGESGTNGFQIKRSLEVPNSQADASSLLAWRCWWRAWEFSAYYNPVLDSFAVVERT